MVPLVEGSASGTGRTRRDGRRARTRERLLGAAMEILRQQGVGAVSVSAVARRVGVHHSLFYQHFKDVDACLAAVTQQALQALGPVERELRRELLRRAMADRRELASYYEASIERWLEQRPVFELVVAHRLDSSPIGEAVRPAIQALGDELAAELWEVAVRQGVDGKRLPEIRMLADLQINHWLWALEQIIVGRAGDLRAFAEMLADVNIATNMTFLRRAQVPSYWEIVAQQFTEQQRATMGEERAALREYVEAHSDAELVEEAGSAQQLVERVLQGMCATFLPRAAGSQSAVVHYRVDTPQGEVRMRLWIQSGRCVVDGLCDAAPPRTTLVMSLRTLLETVSGMRHYNEAYQDRDMEVEGDLYFSVELMDWFFHA